MAQQEDNRPPCNICGLPGLVPFIDPATGREERKRLDCYGHPGVPSYLWNRHPEYYRHAKYLESKQRGGR